MQTEKFHFPLQKYTLPCKITHILVQDKPETRAAKERSPPTKKCSWTTKLKVKVIRYYQYVMKVGKC